MVVTGELRHRQFEVEGNKRSATEVLVSDAGPSMLWATATVIKTPQESARFPTRSHSRRQLLRSSPTAAGVPATLAAALPVRHIEYVTLGHVEG